MREYFSDVSKTPLLTREQEIEVFKRIADGDPEVPWLSLAGLTRAGRRRSPWLTTSG